MRRALRVLGWIVLGVLTLALNLVAAAYLYLRTGDARERVLALAVRRLDGVLAPGSLRVGRSEGNLLEGLVLHDVELRDRDGEIAVRADRLEARYALGALLAGRVQLAVLRVEGALVVSRRLHGGGDSLGTLGAAAPPSAGPAPTLLPLAIVVDELAIDGRMVWVPRGGSVAHTPRHRQLALSATGRADLGRSMVLHVDALAIDVTTPARGHVTAHGAVALAGPVALRSAVVEVDADLRELRRYVEGVALGGPARLRVDASGPIAALEGHVRLDARDAHVRAHAHLRPDAVEVAALSVTLPRASLEGHGRFDFDGRLRAAAHADVKDLSTLARFGAPPLAGRTRLDAELGLGRGTFRVKAGGTVDELRAGGVTLRSATFDVDLVDLRGHARLAARDVRAGDVRLTSAHLDAVGDAQRLSLRASGAGAEHVGFELRALGAPIERAGRLVGAQATLQSLVVALPAAIWRSRGPSAVEVEVEPLRVDVAPIELAAAEQRLGVEAHLRDHVIERAWLDVRNFDFSKLSPLLARGEVLPHSVLWARVDAHGPLDDPDVTAALGGEVYGRGQKDLIHFWGSGDAHLSHHRAVGKLFATIGGQKVAVHVDAPVPLRPHALIDATVDASVRLSPTMSELLVPKVAQFTPLAMYMVSGIASLQVRLSGTTSDPQLHAAARLAHWDAEGAHGELGVSLEYLARQLGASGKLALATARGPHAGGLVSVTAKLPIDLSPYLTGGRRVPLGAEAPLHAEAKLEHVLLDALPLRALGVVSPIQHGRVDGVIDLAGTLVRPRVHVEARAEHVDAVRAGVFDLGGHLTGSIEDDVAEAEAALTIRGAAALSAHAHVEARGPSAWHDPTLDAQVRADGFDLTKLGVIAGLGGALHVDARLTGRARRPDVDGELHVDGLRLGATSFARFALSGRLADGTAHAELRAEQGDGAKLALEVTAPLQARTIDAHLFAHAFVLDVVGPTLPAIRALRGVLDAELRVRGQLADPSGDGSLRLQRGEVRVPTTGIDYHDIDATLRFDHHALRVDHATFKAGRAGSATLEGRVVLASLAPSRVDGELALRQFPIEQQGVGAIVDADVSLHGSAAAKGGLAGALRVRNGHARLPELEQTRVLLPTSGLADVRVVDGKTDARGHRGGLELGALLDGPFEIRGKEVSATARGGFHLEVRDGRPTLRGALHVEPGGWIALFGRRYDLERGRVAFEGGPEPRLDFRISRHLPTATIGVDLHGPAGRPEAEFWSQPPIYDKQQIVGIILSGDPGTTRVSTAGLDRQAAGAISTLVVGSIKRNFIPELPIDVLRVDASQTQGLGAQGSSIEIGKFLTDKLYVGYAYQLGADRSERRVNQNEARLDYRFTKSWELETSFGDAGVGGLDLYWTWRP